MPIQTVTSQVSLPVLGKIRLGVRKESRSGSKYPTTVEYFVLDDAPGVAEVYGPDPKEIDIIFPMDDLETVIPTWLKWYSAGKTDANGVALGGKLNCYGNGPDEHGNPGIAHWRVKQDPTTRVIPTRPCLGPNCPDWKNGKGQQQCKQMMQVFAILPRVSFYGVFQIDTSSWRSIRSFHNQLQLVANLNQGVIKMIPFKIVRETEVTTFFDEKNQEKTGKQHIMKLRPNEGFLERHGQDVRQKLSALQTTQFALSASKQDMVALPAEDHYMTLPEGQTEETVEQTINRAEALLQDPEVKAAFDELAGAMGKTFTDKTRLIAIRKKEHEADMKAAVLIEIRNKLASMKPKAVEPEVVEVEAAPLPPDDNGGIM